MTEATWRTLAQLLDEQAEQDRRLLEQVREMLRAVEAKHANDLWAQRPALRAGLELLHATLEGRVGSGTSVPCAHCGAERSSDESPHRPECPRLSPEWLDTLPEGAVLWRGKRIDTHPDFDRERWDDIDGTHVRAYPVSELDALAGWSDD